MSQARRVGWGGGGGGELFVLFQSFVKSSSLLVMGIRFTPYQLQKEVRKQEMFLPNNFDRHVQFGLPPGSSRCSLVQCVHFGSIKRENCWKLIGRLKMLFQRPYISKSSGGACPRIPEQLEPSALQKSKSPQKCKSTYQSEYNRPDC